MSEWLGYLGNALNAAGEGLELYQNNVVRRIVYGALYQAAKSQTWNPILGSEATRQALITAFERGGHEAAAEAYRQGEGPMKAFLVETLDDPSTFLPVVGWGGKALAATKAARTVPGVGGLARGLKAAGWVGNLPNEALGRAMGVAMKPVAGKVNALLPDRPSREMAQGVNVQAGPGRPATGPATENWRIPLDYLQAPWQKRQASIQLVASPTTSAGQTATSSTTAGFRFPSNYWDLPERERRRLFQEWWKRESQRANLLELLSKSDPGGGAGQIPEPRPAVLPAAAKPKASSQVQPLQMGKVEGAARSSATPAETGAVPRMAGQQAEAQTKARMEKAVRLYGTTTDPNEAGFILPDGRLLRVAGGPVWLRQVEHAKAVAQLFPPAERKGRTRDDLMRQFLGEGNVRMSLLPSPIEGGPAELSIQFSQPLTARQLVAVRRVVAQHGPLDLAVDYLNPATGRGTSSGLIIAARQADVEPTLRALYERAGLNQSGEGSAPRQLHALVQPSADDQVARPAVPAPLRRLAGAAFLGPAEEADPEEGQEAQGWGLPPLSEEGHRRVAEAMLAAMAGENGYPRNAELVWRHWRAASDAERAEMRKDPNIRRLAQERIRPAPGRSQPRPFPVLGLASRSLNAA